MLSPRHQVRRAQLIWCLELSVLANHIVEASVPTIILVSAICKDVGNFYKWLTFRPKGLHHRPMQKTAIDEGLRA